MSLGSSLGLGIVLQGKDEMTPSLRSVGSSLSSLGQTAEQAGGRVTSSMQKMGAAIDAEATHRLGEWVEGKKQFFDEASKKAIGFGKSIAEVSTLLDESAFPAAKMRQIVMDLTSQYGGNSEDQARGLYQTISAGIGDVNKATDLMNVANRLSVAGLTTTTEAVDVLTNSVNTYAKSGLTAQQASDAIMKTVAAGKTTAGELAHFLGLVAPNAAVAGISLQDLLATLGTITVQGIRTRIAVTDIQTALSNVVHPSKEAKDEARRLGIEFSSAAIRAKGFPAFLNSITTNAKFTDDTMGKLFGSVQGSVAMNVLATNKGKVFSDMVKELGNSAGATATAFKKMEATEWFYGRQKGGIAEVLGIQAGEALEPMRKVTRQLGDMVFGFWQSLPEGARAWIIRAGYAATATLGLAVSVMVLKTAFVVLGSTIKGTLLIAAPVAAAVAGIGLMIAAMKVLGDHGDKTSASFMNLGSKIKLGIQGVAQLFSQGGFSGAILTELDKAENQGVKRFAIEVWATLKRVELFFREARSSFKTAVEPLRPVFDSLYVSLGKLGVALGLIKENDPAKNVTSWQQWGEAGRAVGKAMAVVTEAIAKGLTTAIEVITPLINGFRVWWAELEKITKQTAGNISGIARDMDRLQGVTASTTDKTKEFNTEWLTLGNVVSVVVGGAVEGTTILWNVMARGFAVASGYIRGLMMTFNELANVLGGLGEMVSGVFSGNWSKAFEGMKRVALGVFANVAQVALGFAKMFAYILDNLISLADRVTGGRASKLIGGPLNAVKTIEGLQVSVDESLAGAMGIKGPRGLKYLRGAREAEPTAPGEEPMTPQREAAANIARLRAAREAAEDARRLIARGSSTHQAAEQARSMVAQGLRPMSLPADAWNMQAEASRPAPRTGDITRIINLQVDGRTLASVVDAEHRDNAITGWHGMVPAEDGGY